ncbi:MAG: hypothetical protein HQK61_11110, partial [Desulfamplus sp.]|nr:hypothetical protein [Desulfamplus sp.]
MPSLGSSARIIYSSNMPKQSGAADTAKSPDLAGAGKLSDALKSAMVKADSFTMPVESLGTPEPAKTALPAKPVTRLVQKKPESSASGRVSGETGDLFSELFEDQFLTLKDLVNPESDLIKKAKQKSLDDILLLMQANQWDNIISLYYPVNEKNPELVASGTDLPIREKVAFALGQLNRFDEAIAELEICIKREPDNFYNRSSIAYTAYNSLFALKNKEIMLTPEVKAKRIELAHANFEKAQQLRPDGITCFYRQGMLYSQIENKPDPAIPLFSRACANWESLTGEQRLDRHQEKKNYIKSLYRLGSLVLEKGDASYALQRIMTCIAEDDKRDY